MAHEREPESLHVSSRMRCSSTDSMVSESSVTKLHDERTPLLQRQSSHALGEVEHLPTDDSTTTLRPRAILILILIVIAIFTLGDTISDTPQKRIFESIYCYKYWEEHDPTKLLVSRENVGPGAIGGVEEKWCKVASVQADVAMLRGWQIFFDGIPSLLVAIPFGILADRIGRKPIVMLGIFSFILRISWMQFVCWFWQALDLKLVWLSALHGLMSGSSPVVTAIAITITSDVTDDRSRATSFLFISASNMIMYFVGPPLGALLMIINPWIPYFLSTLIYIIAALLFSLIPETLGYTHPDLEQSARDRNSAPITTPIPDPLTTITAPLSLRRRLISTLSTFHTSTSFLYTDLRIALLVLPFVAIMLAGDAGEILLQYASTRFSISYATATLYISITAGCKVLVLLLLYPFAGHVLTSRLNYSGLRKDLTLARWSMVVAALGWTLTGFTTSIPTFIAAELLVTLSYGGTSLTRSFVTGIVRKTDVAKLYTFVSVVETVALMAGAPAMAGLWEMGLRAGEAWYGLPFWVQGAVYAGVAVAIWGVGLRKGEDGEREEEGEREERV
ncbi:Quinidine resistance protein 1 [Sphaceloma murrayae]|uniref:Quinidine resistance protein 1 n=1 Tax=Sphaceloma murrayae TaxID=2082308 RepID=A0A2K1QP49_9PEZI|nr:Quinidine resistance protein 1 [Sphaceloma murrayae]